jgi:uncharacterized protein YbjQ (UPF0145 family)
MATCTQCGQDAGFMASVCDACLARERAQLRAQAEHQVLAAKAAAAVGDRAAERRLEPGFQAQAAAVTLTTASTLAGFRIVETVEVVTAECVMGMSVFGDFSAAVADIFGGRSESTQQVLRDARRTCLRQLKEEAAAAGGNAVIALRLDYSAMGANNSMLFLVASGTAVRVVPGGPDGAGE